MESFNNLEPAQAERLALLLEEMGEAQQAIGKILRHGYESFHPGNPNVSNRASLERELGDVALALALMIGAGDLDVTSMEKHSREKKEKIKPYLHHQGGLVESI